MKWLVRVAGVLFAVTIIVSLLPPARPRPCLATFERVRDGMTREQVYATVGGPPHRVESASDPDWKWEHETGTQFEFECWNGDDGSWLKVTFFDGRAVAS